VAFEPGSAVLSPAGIAEIDAFAAKLRDFPERRVHVVGHSEDHGADAGNPWLSEQRARAVASLLTAEGIAIEHVSLEGVGSDGGGGRTARVSVR
jgi:OOP family OmpA-OmpF porin